MITIYNKDNKNHCTVFAIPFMTIANVYVHQSLWNNEANVCGKQPSTTQAINTHHGHIVASRVGMDFRRMDSPDEWIN